MKKSTNSDRPSKPYPDFPLYAHATKRWAKKINGKLYYFGPWDDPDAALKKYTAERDDLYAGRKPQQASAGVSGKRIADLVNEFLSSKRLMVDGGELTARSWRDYYLTCERIVKAFGRERVILDVGPNDFDQLKAKLAKTNSPLTVGNEVNRVRVIFNWAFEQALIDRPMRFGPAFKRPTKRIVRLERAKRGPRMLEADEIRKLLDTADAPMKAMILLGVNAGLGNTDLADLQFRHLMLDAGWLDYPRPKTGVGRRAKIWPETIEAVRAAVAVRPAPTDEADAGCVFLTDRGRRVTRMRDRPDDPETGKPRPGVVCNAVTRDFGKLLVDTKLARPGLGFYALRHSFETIAGESRDQVAVDVVMGHDDHSMGGTYRERISDDRLAAVAEVVRAWLWPKEQQEPTVLAFSTAAS
jgi:integrase